MRVFSVPKSSAVLNTVLDHQNVYCMNEQFDRPYIQFKDYIAAWNDKDNTYFVHARACNKPQGLLITEEEYLAWLIVPPEAREAYIEGIYKARRSPNA